MCDFPDGFQFGSSTAAHRVEGALFLAWAFARPLGEELEDEGPEPDDRTVEDELVPVGADAAAFGDSETTSRPARRDRAGAVESERFRRE